MIWRRNINVYNMSLTRKDRTVLSQEFYFTNNLDVTENTRDFPVKEDTIILLLNEEYPCHMK